MILGGVSLLLNIFLVGLIIGHVFAADRQGRGSRPGAPGGGPGGVGMVAGAQVKSLSPDQKRDFMEAMAPHRRGIRLAREAHRAVRQTIEADIAAPTFDRAKVAADFEALRHANDAIGEVVDAALLDAFASLSPESRAAIVAHPEQGRPAPQRP